MEFDFSKIPKITPFSSNPTNIISVPNSNTNRRFPWKIVTFFLVCLIIYASWNFILNVVAWVTVGGSVGLAIKKVGTSILGLGK